LTRAERKALKTIAVAEVERKAEERQRLRREAFEREMDQTGRDQAVKDLKPHLEAIAKGYISAHHKGSPPIFIDRIGWNCATRELTIHYEKSERMP
jgi:hypothetical protein